MLCIEVFYEKNGQQKSLGLLSAQSGDDAAELLAKKAKKLVQKAGGGEVKLIDMGKALPFSALSNEQRAQVTGPDAENPGTLTEPRPFNPNVSIHSSACSRMKDSKSLSPSRNRAGHFSQL